MTSTPVATRPRRRWRLWPVEPIARHGVWVTGLAPLLPMLLGSAVNIWYNLLHVEPLLTPDQHARFVRTIVVFNALVYPPGVAGWLFILRRLEGPFRTTRASRPVAPERLQEARRLAINLPWWAALIAGTGWFLCIPVFLVALEQSPDPLDGRLYAHLPISFGVSGLIAVTHACFVVELLSQQLLYPVLFRDARPADTRGVWALSLRGRGLLWAVSAGVCPIGSLLLLHLGPRHVGRETPWFPLAVGGLGIVFGLATAWLVGRLVVQPVHALRRAAQAVAAGDLGARIPLLRADEFGPLIDAFNDMTTELGDKARIEETFGRHVGRTTARLILGKDPGLGGSAQELTVVFVDIRNFTARSSHATPERTVALLNLFLTEMVEVVEQRHGGIVNKFLGDGFMALFGEWTGRDDHADAALAAGQEMLRRLARVNALLAGRGESPLAIGVGIHTGRAVVGSIGSPRRMEYTAIGDTVNLASRVEGLTKVVGAPLLFTAATRAALRTPPGAPVESLPPQPVKGEDEAVAVFRLADTPAP